MAEKVEKKKENRIQRWWRETLGEMRKVSWPTMQDARRLTLIVIAVVIAMSLLLGAFDFIFSRLVALLLG